MGTVWLASSTLQFGREYEYKAAAQEGLTRSPQTVRDKQTRRYSPATVGDAVGPPQALFEATVGQPEHEQDRTPL